ncbi:MAG: HAD hydrolase-like protein [Lachnospiraceae bacterium]|nr:HAD hydrolase-like protein [Lachnospiraceae bacterium]
MVGDRDQDIEGAKANGLDSAGVLWGYGSEEELKNAGADHILTAAQDLLELTWRISPGRDIIRVLRWNRHA